MQVAYAQLGCGQMMQIKKTGKYCTNGRFSGGGWAEPPLMISPKAAEIINTAGQEPSAFTTKPVESVRSCHWAGDTVSQSV